MGTLNYISILGKNLDICIWASNLIRDKESTIYWFYFVTRVLATHGDIQIHRESLYSNLKLRTNLI